MNASTSACARSAPESSASPTRFVPVSTTGPDRFAEALAGVPGLAPVLEALGAVEGRYGRTFLVGGAVRDALLGRPFVDVDIAVEGAGVELAEALAERLAGRATGHEQFGTATVTFGEQTVDVASTRSETYGAPGALPTVASSSVEHDLARRDFTVNAMAIALEPLERGRLVDPHGGESDLAEGTLRVLHDASFVDDPTRLIRAARYEARYGLTLDPLSDTLARTAVAEGSMRTVSATRIGNELVLLLDEEAGVDGLARLAHLGVVEAIHPALDAGQAALETMRGVEALRGELQVCVPLWRLRLSVLAGRLEPSPRERWLDELQLSRSDVHAVGRAASVRLRWADDAHVAGEANVLRELSREPLEGPLLALADARPGSAAARVLRAFLIELRHIELEIDGSDLAALGLHESPAVGDVLDAVLVLKIEGAVSTRQEELEAAAELIARANPR